MKSSVQKEEQVLLPTPAELRFGKGWKILIPFVFLPLLIISAAVGVFLLFGKLAQQELTPQEYLEKIRSGGTHKRWQAAYELSRHLARGNVGKDRIQFEKEIRELFKNSKLNEQVLRRYLLIALGQVGSKDSISMLEEVVQNDVNTETQIYALLALARIGLPRAQPVVAKQVESEDPGLRKAAAFALGFVGSPKDIETLKKLLDDNVKDVRWNAALGLAKLGSSAGEHELLQLLEPEYIRKETPNLREAERIEIILSAANALGQIRSIAAIPKLQTLSESATDSRLRIAATNVLKAIKAETLTKTAVFE